MPCCQSSSSESEGNSSGLNSSCEIEFGVRCSSADLFIFLWNLGLF